MPLHDTDGIARDCGSGLLRSRRSEFVGQAAERERKFAAESVLPPFDSVDFVDGHVQLERGANESIARRPGEFEARIRRACGSNDKARVVVSAIDQADSPEAIRTTHAVAISALVHCNSRGIGVAEDERLVGLVLKPESRVDKPVVGDDAGAKVGDGGGKVAGFVAKLLVAAHTGRGRSSRSRAGRGSGGRGGG